MFTVFGIKVKPRLAFFLVIGFIGFGAMPLEQLPVWAAVAFVSILIHELGHALVVKAYGNQPEIEFLFFGAATKFSTKGITPARQALIAFAGPLAGIAVALPGALWMLSLVGPSNTLLTLVNPALGFRVLSDQVGPWLGVAVWSLTWTGGVWGALNLAPIRSLDGGQVLSGVVKTLSPRFGIPITEAIFGLTFAAGLGWAVLERNLWIGFLIFLFGRPDIQAVRTWWDERRDGPALQLLEEANAAYQARDWQSARSKSDEAHQVAVGSTTRAKAETFRIGSRLALGQTTEAADIAETAQQVDPRIRAQALAAAGRHETVVAMLGGNTRLSPQEHATLIFSLNALGRSDEARDRARRGGADVAVLLQAARAADARNEADPGLAELVRISPDATPAQVAEAALLSGDPQPAIETPNLDERIVAVALAQQGGLAAVDARFPDLAPRSIPHVQVALHRTDRFEDAIDFAQRHRFADQGGLLAYNRAASEARLGRVNDAIASLRTARRAGFDISLAGRDDDFAAIRAELGDVLG